jgi:hypothetical protein
VVVLDSVIAASDTTGTETAVSLAYPLADLAVIFAVLTLIARSGSSSATGPLVFLALGFGAIAVSDSSYTYLTQIGEYGSGSYIDAGWLAGYVLVAMAGAARIHQYASSEATAGAADDPPRLWQEVVMYAPVLGLGGLVIADPDLRSGPAIGIFVAIVALMFLRQLITHRQILKIYERQLGFAGELESKVRVQNLELWRRRAWEKEYDPADVNLPAPTRDWEGAEPRPRTTPTGEPS